MPAEERQGTKQTEIGFAGLASLVSDVDTLVGDRETKPSDKSKVEDAAGRPRSEPQPKKEPAARQETYQHTARMPQAPSLSAKWLGGIGLVFGLMWLFSIDSDNERPPAAGRTTANRPERVAAQLQAPGRLSEERPPVGTNLVLNPAQIRYCLAEDIRLGAANEVLNNGNASDVERFNAMVLDYNSRCAYFRYRKGSLESAKSDVEVYRTALETEGRGRFALPLPQSSYSVSAAPQSSYSVATAPVDQPVPSPTVSKSDIRQIQQHLNTLGYEAGLPDGIEGRKTRTAITAFQKDYGISPNDGVASKDVLSALIILSPTCRFKPVMSEADYRLCGITPPQQR